MIFETLDNDNVVEKGSDSEEGENLFYEEEQLPNVIEQSEAIICTTFRGKKRHTSDVKDIFSPIKNVFSPVKHADKSKDQSLELFMFNSNNENNDLHMR